MGTAVLRHSNGRRLAGGGFVDARWRSPEAEQGEPLGEPVDEAPVSRLRTVPDVGGYLTGLRRRSLALAAQPPVLSSAAKVPPSS